MRQQFSKERSLFKLTHSRLLVVQILTYIFQESAVKTCVTVYPLLDERIRSYDAIVFVPPMERPPTLTLEQETFQAEVGVPLQIDLDDVITVETHPAGA